MVTIKNEFLARGEDEPKKPRYTRRYSRSRFTYSKKSGGSSRRYGRRYARGPSVSSLASAVARQLQKSPQAALVSRQPKNIVMHASHGFTMDPIYMHHQHQEVDLKTGVVTVPDRPISTLYFLPVTWAIPTERQHDDPPDDRFRSGNRVFVRGARVRFTVFYKEVFRMRLAAYSPHHSQKYPFEASLVPNAGATLAPRPVQSWVNGGHDPALLVPNGPFKVYNIQKSEGTSLSSGGGKAPPANPVWRFASPDRSIISADLATGASRPFKTLTVNGMGSAGAQQWKEVDWYVDINRWFDFDTEQSQGVNGSGVQIILVWDTPHVLPTGATMPPSNIHGFVEHLTVQVYYR